MSETKEPPGTAKIKKEFIVEVPLSSSISQEKVIDKVPSVEENVEPPPKKKHRGQNKHRPQTKRNKTEECLCPSLVFDSGVCTFGQNCRFMHDVSKYMKNKPEDIGPECYAFKNHGKCPFKFACRYASHHVIKSNEDEYVNKEDVNLVNQNPQPVIINVSSRDILMSLRKKKYKFPKSLTVPCVSKKSNANRKMEEKVPPTPASDSKEQQSTLPDCTEKTLGVLTDEDSIKIRKGEKKTIEFHNKLYLAPLTTCGNLPFRVICKTLGADITCGEMALATSLLQGNTAEWALLKKHPCEDMFGVQICGAFPDSMTKCAELIDRECEVDFVDINMGCPIDLVYNKGSGSALMHRTRKLYDIVESAQSVLNVPLTCKMRTGIDNKHNVAHTILPQLQKLGVNLCTVHGRSRQARYTKFADWNYIEECAKAASPMPVFGNGDILSFEDYNQALTNKNIAGVMIARGALIKPWIFTEIKEQRCWDISSSERFDILKKYVNVGLLHWGSDTRGVETTRKFLLEWLSFLHRFIPVGVLERIPQRINERPPLYVGRDDLETLMSSSNCKSWVQLSEMLLGKVPESFQFLPKHKANSYR